ncbi:triose-phosphate isomerase [Iamia sp.]|uniref:triose-phosphate isomerase n=1 Tax=Iamia sp. TaxID=2722710 RepID=UPI002C514AF3|nr:triose-phosphate isomerase [Iamia sp.]HXH58277.1 triose-phosphate isomerase [Iamia sp.]
MATRIPLISGNWKMHHNHFEALATVQKLSYLLGDDRNGRVEVSIHAPFTDLRSLQTSIEQDDMDISLGAQHCHWEDKGAFTGEVSPAMLAKLNVRYVIAGHSERREVFGETDEWVNNKVLAILRHGMTPILCCGETLDEREGDRTEDKVAGQVRAGLAGVSPEQVGALVLAYEPIWAIGTGRTATADDAQATCALVRGTVAEVAGAEAAAAVRVQYGGSVKPANAAELMGQPDIDGALVGGASLDADDFAKIVRGIDA